MKKVIILITVCFSALIFLSINAEPGFNGTNPGCSGSSCHTLEEGIVTLSVTDLQIQVTVHNTTSKVAGELVDSNGTVVAVINSTSSNPFTLNAPGPGNYIVNAGFKNPSPRRWDSAMVNISVTNLNEKNTSPVSFKLYNNYPNPFNPVTIIRYRLPVTGMVSLKVYDIIGNEISTLVNETKSTGEYEVNFDGTNLPSGVYFYQLNAGKFNETKKMLLLK